jgi:cytochrome P450
LVAQLLDRAGELGDYDYVVDVAGPLSRHVVAELCDVPISDRPYVFELADRTRNPRDGNSPSDDSLDASMDLVVYFHQRRDARRRDWRELASSSSGIDTRHMSPRQLYRFFLLLWVAGQETLCNLLSWAALLLIEHPEARAPLRADPKLGHTCVEEMARRASPIMQRRRTAVRDVELHGQRIARGDKVLVWYISANHDEDVFTDPMRFKIDRTPNAHVAFGTGPHYCLSALVSRVFIGIVLEELVERPDLEIGGQVERRTSNGINGIDHLPVRFS